MPLSIRSLKHYDHFRSRDKPMCLLACTALLIPIRSIDRPKSDGAANDWRISLPRLYESNFKHIWDGGAL